MKKQSMTRLAAIALVSMGAFATVSAQAYAQTDVADAQGHPGGARATLVADLQGTVAGVQREVAENHAPAAVAAQHAKAAQDRAANACVGPVSFCSVFFGS
ncbi:hypothetical protein PWR63_32355 [Paraburkholderia sp. A2WS-5]|uniref:hypothetical protein n=1 Tax=unclassified Paraburkholderia TaxID=2615204 RepID=UPI003B7DD22D